MRSASKSIQPILTNLGRPKFKFNFSSYEVRHLNRDLSLKTNPNKEKKKTQVEQLKPSSDREDWVKTKTTVKTTTYKNQTRKRCEHGYDIQKLLGKIEIEFH